MYKHHSYNNLVEKKLTQLPAPDAEGLWSGMEAILDKQLPQKKRKPRLIGWLFAHKAWVLATLFVGAAAASTLVYLPGDDNPAVVHTPAVAAATKKAATPVRLPSPEAATAPDAAAPVQGTAAAPTATAKPSAHTPASTTQNTINPEAALAPTTTPVNKKVLSASKPSTTRSEGPVKHPAASDLSAKAAATAAGHATPTTEEASASSTQWAAHTRFVAHQPAVAPPVDLQAVKVDTEVLEHLAQQVAASAAAAMPAGRLPQEKGPYVGVIVGLDMSSVEFGSVKTGSNKGLLVGYAFNNRWSVESGLLWNKKQFSADGSYYKADGYVPQPGLTILDVNSTSQLYELPLNVKYNILAGRNKLFATAGVSSYLIKRENIDLHYDWNGQQGNQYYDYSNPSKHWLSVANLSVGYTVPVGSFGSLRLEPYVKMPLKELGVCNMRVTSMGLNVGITKMLKR
jgi:hypothetical protein